MKLQAVPDDGLYVVHPTAGGDGEGLHVVSTAVQPATPREVESRLPTEALASDSNIDGNVVVFKTLKEAGIDRIFGLEENTDTAFVTAAVSAGINYVSGKDKVSTILAAIGYGSQYNCPSILLAKLDSECIIRISAPPGLSAAGSSKTRPYVITSVEQIPNRVFDTLNCVMSRGGDQDLCFTSYALGQAIPLFEAEELISSALDKYQKGLINSTVRPTLDISRYAAVAADWASPSERRNNSTKTDGVLGEWLHKYSCSRIKSRNKRPARYPNQVEDILFQEKMYWKFGVAMAAAVVPVVMISQQKLSALEPLYPCLLTLMLGGFVCMCEGWWLKTAFPEGSVFAMLLSKLLMFAFFFIASIHLLSGYWRWPVYFMIALVSLTLLSTVGYSIWKEDVREPEVIEQDVSGADLV